MYIRFIGDQNMNDQKISDILKSLQFAFMIKTSDQNRITDKQIKEVLEEFIEDL